MRITSLIESEWLNVRRLNQPSALADDGNRFVVVVIFMTIRRCRWTAFSAKKCFTISLSCSQGGNDDKTRQTTDSRWRYGGWSLGWRNKKASILCVSFGFFSWCKTSLGQGNYEWQKNCYAAHCRVFHCWIRRVDTVIYILLTASPHREATTAKNNIDFGFLLYCGN